MHLEIREATVADVPTLFAIRTAVRENQMTMAELASVGVTPETVADLIRSENARTWLGLCDTQPSAFAMARIVPGDLFALFVLPNREGLGLGSLFLAEAEDWLSLYGVQEAWLLTGRDPALRAAQFYSSRGWRTDGHEADGQVRFTKCLTPRR
jgi:GNAT superfamily N-acetyltransferase